MPNKYKKLRFPILWGLIFLGLGGYRLLNDYFFFKNAVRNYGTIVKAESYTSKASVIWNLDIKFNLLNNNEERISHLKTVDGVYSEGGHIRFFYNPARPSEVRLDDHWDRWAQGIGFIFFGLVPFLLIGIHRIHVLMRKKHWDPWN